MINIFPEFESRQVLTSDELNWMACYLDTQNRQSRRFLLGSGLIGGLQVKLVSNGVQVTNGIGITSAGHLLMLSNDQATVTTFTKARKYSQKANEKLAYPYLSDMDVNEENYAKSITGGSIYFQLFKDDVIELFEQTVNDADPIDANTLKGSVAMLFAEILQKELKDCEGDNCQEKGKKYIFTTKVLVISKEDAIRLLMQEYDTQSSNEDAISRLAFPWMHLPNMNILKPVFSNSQANTLFDEKFLVQEYLRCISDLVASLETNKTELEQSVKNLCDYCSTVSVTIPFIGPLIDSVKATGVLNTGNVSVSLTEMVYDYLWCFTKAYLELQVEAQALKAKTFTLETAFPNHILLGVMDNQNENFETAVPAGYSIYRHYFQSRFVQTQQAELCKKICVCVKRLTTIATAFEGTAQNNKNEIKITAGGGLYSRLSNHAIPWYLKQTVLSVWNNFAAHPKLNKYITSYSTINETQVPSVQLSYNTLASAFQGNHDFFRIEGVYGQSALQALNTVFQLRKKHGLSFEVLMLRLNEKAPFSHSFNFTINEDIESMYQVVRSELRKQVSFNINYLSGLQLKFGKLEPMKTILTNALKDSYMGFLVTVNNTILLQPLPLALDQAITASNITSNYKAESFTDDPKYSELETAVSSEKAVTSSSVRMANIGITKGYSSSLEIFRRKLDFQFGVLFLNTIGNLINSIKSSEQFKGTSNISFYSQLLSVVKQMQRTNKQQLLFLYAVQIFAALKLQEEYLPENFLELDITKYTDNLDDELLTASNALVDYLKTQTADSLSNDDILDVVTKDEMLSYAQRIRFDDDWVKIIQLDAENKKRNGGLGVENLLERFVKLNPGLAHGCGVPKGGTYIMVYDAGNVVIADFYLPYIISSHLRPIQYTLVDQKTLTLSGTIKDTTGKPVETTLLVGTTTVISDKDGFYNALVAENTTVKLVCKVSGFKNFEQELQIKDKSQTLDIVLQPADVTKSTTKIKFTNQLKKVIARDITLVNINSGKSVTATNGVLSVNDVSKTEYKFEVKDASFESKQFAFTLGDTDQEVQVELTELDIIRIQIVAQPQFTESLLKEIQVVEPAMELDKSGSGNGSFTTKERIDITKSAIVNVLYNDQRIKQKINPGAEVNNIVIKAVENPNMETKLKTILSIVNPDIQRANAISSFSINDADIRINLETNIGEGTITTKGVLDLRREFRNVKPLDIERLPDVKGVVCVIDGSMLKERERITEEAFLTFTSPITAVQLRTLSSKRKEFRVIAKSIDLTVENFYCMLLPADQIKEVREILSV